MAVEALGYGHASYAASLREFGTPRYLAASEAWCLTRQIPGSTLSDAMGCYPLLTANNWEGLASDLKGLDGLVTFTAVCDPLQAGGPERLSKAFDVVRPFKQHVIVDLRCPAPSRHHRRQARTASRQVRIRTVAEPSAFIDEWMSLYEVLVNRHHLRGLHAFSSEAFSSQLSVPGVRMLCAADDDGPVAASMWYVADRIAYLHLLASNDRGYDASASYALLAESFDVLKVDADRANLGGWAGTKAQSDDEGLMWFKRGWSETSVTAYLCGSILNNREYKGLCCTAPADSSAYFPAYRRPQALSAARELR